MSNETSDQSKKAATTEEFFDDLRQKRLSDPAVRANGCCEKCDFQGYYHIEGKIEVRSCECALRKAARGRLDKVGVPRRFRNMAFDQVIQEAGENYDTNRVNFLRFLMATYVADLDAINAGNLIPLSFNGTPRQTRSVVMVGGERRVKSAWASQLVEEKVYQHGMFRYFEFSELKAILTDFDRADEQIDFVWEMENCNLVIIDGIQGGWCGPAFPANWGRAIAARQNAGLTTILLCEQDHFIDSYAWQDMLSDPETFVINLKALAANPTLPSVQTNAPKSTSLSSIASIDLTSTEGVKQAIVAYLQRNPDKIIKLIYDNVAANRETVKTALDELIDANNVKSKKKDGGKGVMTVFYVPSTSDYVSATQPKQEQLTHAKEEQMTLEQLHGITGIPKSTLWRYRKSGRSDEDIIISAEKLLD